jgi:hypothetical protein
MRGKLLIGILAAAAVGTGTAEAKTQADLEVAFSARSPSSSTGASLRAYYEDADDPDAKPSPITSLVIELPEGFRYDGAAVPACEASDEELRALGRKACPAGSAIGSGTFTALTGFGPPIDPFVGDVTAFNGGDEIIELVSFRGTDQTAGFDRLHVEGNKLTAEPPATPGGPPDGRTAVREIELGLPARGSAESGRALMTTPKRCPRAGTWSSLGAFGFLDGSVDAARAESPCIRPGRPRLRVSVEPRSARAGRATSFRFLVRAPSAGGERPVAGAKIRFAKEVAYSDASGRARIVQRFTHAARYRPHARKAGYVTGKTSVRVTD